MTEPTDSSPSYKYDAFISYSHRDEEWVLDVLLQRLEQEGLTVCIDERNFEIGVPVLINMERAVQQSRKTLLVLTPDWVASQWTDFEALLIQTKDPVGRGQRMLPLMVRNCDLPDRLSIFTYLDLRNPADFDFQMRRLVEAIRGAGREKPSLKPISHSEWTAPKSSGYGYAFTYERSLERLSELLANADTETMLNFAVLEARLRENLRSESLFGSTETLRNERARIVYELNRIALDWDGSSFMSGRE